MQPARLVVRVESAARRMLPQDLIVESLQSPVIVDRGNAGICIWEKVCHRRGEARLMH